MSSLEALTAFFGWCTVLNLGMLVFTSILVMVMRDTMTRVHARMFGVSEADLPRVYFQYLAYYQLAIWVLNLAPYVALKMMA